MPPKEQTKNGVSLLKIKIPKQANPQIFSQLKEIFAKYPGDTSVSLVIPDREGAAREIKTEFTVNNSEIFKTDLKTVLRKSIM